VGASRICASEDTRRRSAMPTVSLARIGTVVHTAEHVLEGSCKVQHSMACISSCSIVGIG